MTTHRSYLRGAPASVPGRRAKRAWSATIPGLLRRPTRHGGPGSPPLSMWRAAFLIGAVLLSGAPRSFAGQGSVTGFFALLDEAPLVVTATVADRIDDAAPGMVVYELAVLQVLKGTPPAKNPLGVQELVFPSDRPALTGGEVWLVALDPLPTSSRYRTLPADKIYLHIRDVRLPVRFAQGTAAC